MIYMKRLIIFLIRRRLGLKKNERFRFANQKSTDIYWFTDTALVKDVCPYLGYEKVVNSGVKLNYLLSDECKVVKQVK